MTTREIRGYAVALALLGFSGAWFAAAHDTQTSTAATSATTATTTADARWSALVARRRDLAQRAASAERIIARRRAKAAEQAAQQVIVRSAPRVVYAPSSSPVTAPAPAPAPAPATATRSS